MAEVVSQHSVYPPSLLSSGMGGGGGLNLLPNFEKGKLGRTLIFRGGWVERGGDRYEGGRGGGGLQFLCKK